MILISIILQLMKYFSLTFVKPLCLEKVYHNSVIGVNLYIHALNISELVRLEIHILELQKVYNSKCGNLIV